MKEGITDVLKLSSIKKLNNSIILTLTIEPNFYTLPIELNYPERIRQEFFIVNSKIEIKITGGNVLDFYDGIKSRYLNTNVLFFIEQKEKYLTFWNYEPWYDNIGVGDMEDLRYELYEVKKI
ncbi:hypothetical protein [Telluribacter sp.]|jgi:hypothetical protein|uniref:hypothetical protein n=1 Tax=Telluribacter sp. TaxID=1978767 RepID=UPI002E0DD75E|nr:hypothetical protein [Telluribacter sp.]